jgi:hypothetical protein
MLAYLNDPTLKATMMTSLRDHKRHDDFVRGKYWDADLGKGCAVGCSLESIGVPADQRGRHALYPELLGIPEQIAKLIDSLFENLPDPDYKSWPVRIMDAIPVGADLSHVPAEWLLWLLIDKRHGVIQYATTDRQRKIIRDVADLYVRRLADDEPTRDEWSTAADAATASATASVDAASAATATASAYASAYASASASAYAASASASAYAASASAAYAASASASAYAASASAYAADAYAAAARYKARKDQAAKLIALCKSAPTKGTPCLPT